MPTLAEFIQINGITMTAKQADSNPNMPNSDMDDWRCILRHGAGDRMILPFSMGHGLNGKTPTAEDVLDVLASDAAGIENARDFDDWCSEYGYDTDSRSALKTYQTCQKQAARLKTFVGSQYDTLLFDIER